MSLLTIVSDLAGLTAAVRENTSVLTRIAEAFERVSPPIPAAPDADAKLPPMPDGFFMSESPAEYEARTRWEAELAISLGMAPWSPQVQLLLQQMRADLMQPRIVTNEEGTEQSEVTLTSEEAIQAIRDAFREAAAEANTR